MKALTTEQLGAIHMALLHDAEESDKLAALVADCEDAQDYWKKKAQLLRDTAAAVDEIRDRIYYSEGLKVRITCRL